MVTILSTETHFPTMLANGEYQNCMKFKRNVNLSEGQGLPDT